MFRDTTKLRNTGWNTCSDKDTDIDPVADIDTYAYNQPHIHPYT